MSLRSALYVGSVAHRRLAPMRHDLRNRVYWLLLDLEELEALDRELSLFSYNKPNLFSIYDRDHGSGMKGAPSLFDQARAHLRAANVVTNGLSVRLFCMPRVLGYDFNPLSVYYCDDAKGELVALIYEVNNTFGGRHSYVIPTRPGRNTTVRQVCEKAFYVSPFMDLKMTYRFRTRPPDENVVLAVQARQDGRAVINTGLRGQKRDLSDLNLLRLAFSHPVLPTKVTGAIYWNALRMWWHGFAISDDTPSATNSVSVVHPNQ